MTAVRARFLPRQIVLDVGEKSARKMAFIVQALS
jgi:hypothetical protein